MNNITQKQLKNKNKIWLIVVIIVSMLCVIASLNKNWVYTEYDYMVNSDHFNKNDAVYVKSDFFKNSEINAIGLFREIRPLTNQEVDTILFISDLERSELKKKLRNSKQYLVDAHIAILKDNLLKYKTCKIGSYLKKDILYFKGFDKNGNEVISSTNFYAIKPNTNLLYVDPLPYIIPIPKYYKWANDVLYIHPFDASNEKLLKFGTR